MQNKNNLFRSFVIVIHFQIPSKVPFKDKKRKEKDKNHQRSRFKLVNYYT